MTSSLDFKKIGIWTGAFEMQPASKLKQAVAELEQLGYGAVWYSEALGRESLTQAALLLSASSEIVIATGIANIYGRDPVTMAAAQKTLSEAYPNRFLLGLGVSHVPFVERLRGHAYEKPVAKMSGYLNAMDQAPYQSGSGDLLSGAGRTRSKDAGAVCETCRRRSQLQCHGRAHRRGTQDFGCW